nr:MFS transporter [Serratia odorifera]
MPQPVSSAISTAAATRRRLHRPLLLIVGIMLVAANLRAALTSVGPLLEQIQQQLTLSATAAGLLNSLPLILFALLSPVTPALAQRIGIERTLGLALLMLVLGIALRSQPPTSLLWLGSGLIGAAIAFANVLLPTLVKRDFPQRAAAMISAYAAVMSLVAAIASGMAVPLAALHDNGWRFSLLCWGLPALLALLVWLPQLRNRALPQTDAPTGAIQGAIAVSFTVGQRARLAGRAVYGTAVGHVLHHHRLVQRLCRQPWHLGTTGRFRTVHLPGGGHRGELRDGDHSAARARPAGYCPGQFFADFYRRRRVITVAGQFAGMAGIRWAGSR